MIQEYVLPVSSKENELANKVRNLIIQDLHQLKWNVKIDGNRVIVKPPQQYDKRSIKDSMNIKRKEILAMNDEWIQKYTPIARKNLTTGIHAFYSNIKPIIEVCESREQHNLFRILRYYWSSPHSEYVGRRIKLIIRDGAVLNNPVIGIAALGSPIIHIPERDDWIGWDKEIRTQNINYMMDAYVVGALPPYNSLLGGKLVSYLLASKEVRKIYERKYSETLTRISKRKLNKLAGIFTTSLYGHSSQYNRIRFNDLTLYNQIGYTKGFGSFHLRNETISSMLEYLESKGIVIKNDFGEGPSWVMRVIRTTGELLGFDADFLLNHSFQRGIYFVPFAENSLEFLRGETTKLNYYNFSASQLTRHWKKRWLHMRKENNSKMNEMKWFVPSDFDID